MPSAMPIAIKWLRKAAVQGHMEAQYHMGIAYQVCSYGLHSYGLYSYGPLLLWPSIVMALYSHGLPQLWPYIVMFLI